ncbi:MAG: ATP-binding protein [Firmicutes bacterium]|nr:ATP-binding protein [Bacillota bacterium]
MIQKLKKKMVAAIMFYITLIILVLLLLISIVPFIREYRDVKNTLLHKAVDLNPAAPSGQIDRKPGNEEKTGGNRKKDGESAAFFLEAVFNENGELLFWNSNRTGYYEAVDVLEFQAAVSEKGQEFGIYNQSYYLYRTFPNHSILLIQDNSISFHNLLVTLMVTAVSCAAAWVLLLFLSIWMVRRMTAPIADAFQKQRQFISDAGHELKTPVAVISANADVLQNEVGENRWLSYIRQETVRMDDLIRNLMLLTQMDDRENRDVHSDFDLSETVEGAALPFESLAFERRISMEMQVAPGISLRGNPSEICQLVGILLSNAIEYGDEGGTIRITLTQQHKKAVLSVLNTGIGIAPGELERIFDRFYRVDKDRSRKTGNYGLGLSIAMEIALHHHAELHAESEYGKWADFRCTFPVQC